MALTVRPDDEVYQFDTVWLGPDEYTLPIQARYVAWGTWLACFLVAAAVLIPLGGDGPAGVLGSLVWSLALSVVLSRAVMLVVDHERPLRSLPALFSAEARAAMASRRRRERALLVRPGKVRVRGTPDKVRATREREKQRAERKAERRHRTRVEPASHPVLPPAPEAAGPLGPDGRRAGAVRPEWTPEQSPAAGGNTGRPEAAPAWAVPADRPDGRAETGQPGVPLTVPVPVPDADPVAPHADRDRAGGAEPGDKQAAAEARVLLPARKDR